MGLDYLHRVVSGFCWAVVVAVFSTRAAKMIPDAVLIVTVFVFLLLIFVCGYVLCVLDDDE